MNTVRVFQITKISLLVLLAGLPLHASITVFLPNMFRFWKEGILLILLGVLIVLEIKNRNEKRFSMQKSSLWAGSFLALIGIQVLFSSDFETSILSARYLGLGFFVFWMMTRLYSHIPEIKKWLKSLSRVFVFSCVFSVGFGIWAQFFGGFETLMGFYSQTISSWVPGQTIPLYHELNGVPRMQGTSSGPVEFAHLLLAGLFLLSYAKLPRWMTLGIAILFFFGIWESASRAVLFISLFGLLFLGFQKFQISNKKQIYISFGVLILGTISLFGVPNLQEKFIQRVGTVQHITRPIKAFSLGLKHPFLGNLGSIGPAARLKNLKNNNNDQAFISENVFADYWVQLGVFGVILSLGFFITLFKESTKNGKLFIVGVFLLGNMATIFDMTPLSLLFFIIFVLFLKKETLSLTSPSS